jgi:SAM-dependent methyltransferase
MTGTGNDVGMRRLRAASPIDTEPCPICRTRGATPTFVVEGHAFQVVVCSGCGTGRFEPFPSPDEIAGFYPPTYYGGAGRKFTSTVEGLVRSLASRKARALSRGLPAGGRVLDVGCGRGTLLGDLADLGFDTHGVEVSQAAAEGVDPRTRIRIAWTLAEAGYPAESFDLVILWHVLEHLPDPIATLREIHRILRPDGQVSIAVPNFSSLQAKATSASWFHLDPPRHLFHFPLRALRSMLSDSGFETVSVSHFSMRQNPFGWVQSTLNALTSQPRNSLYSILQNTGTGEVSTLQRTANRLAFVVGMPVGLALSALAALLRSGATVSVRARKRD